MDVLLVEDDEIDELAVRRLFSNDATIHCVTSLTGAIDSLSERTFHLVLLDLGLPDSMGFETFTRLRAEAPDVPIVVMTGVDDNNLAVKAIKEGAQDFLVKGYFDGSVLKSLGFAVERNKLVRKLEKARNDQAKLELDLRDRERQLAHMGRVALLGEVTAEIAHEVSQPLQAISNVVSVMQIKTDSEETLELVQQIQTDLNLAQAILQRTRQFSKNSETEFSGFSLNTVVHETVEFVESERARVRANIGLELTEASAFIYADHIQILQVLVNLVRNALDVLKEQELDERRILIRTGREKEMVFVEVQDSGPGLTLDTDEVFTAFVTTKADGLGMGLAICSRIIAEHNGTISVCRTDDRTIFKVVLPGTNS